jgi:ABC-type dipeptide/oligopeptide/nickel transport system permease component
MTNAFAFDIGFLPGGAMNRRGHWYFWGLSDGVIVGDTFITAFNTLMTTFANALIAGFALVTGGTANFVTYTRKTKTATQVVHYVSIGKATGFNKRTVPIT